MLMTLSLGSEEECSEHVVIMRDTCIITGTPVEEEMFEGPARVLPFQGIELDTIRDLVASRQASTVAAAKE